MNLKVKKRIILILMIVIFVIFLYDYNVLFKILFEWNNTYIMENIRYPINIKIKFWHLFGVILMFIFLIKLIKNKK